MLSRSELTFFGQIPRSTQSLTARHNGNLHQRIAIAQQPTDGGVSRLVIGNVAFLLFGENFRFFLQSTDNSVDCIEKILLVDHLFVVTGGYKRGLVAHIGDVGSREARRLTRQEIDVDALIEFQRTHVNLENGFALVHIGQFHMNLTIETPCTQQCLVENISAVGGGKHYHTAICSKAVHLGK